MNAASFVPLLVALLLAAVLSPSPARAGAPAPQVPAAFDLAALDKLLGAEVQRKGRVGLTVGVVKDGQLALAKGYGRRALAPPLPVETDTLFALGSLTKQFTAACVLLLAEEGKLSVHDPVGKYFPALTRAADITLLDLMNHVSGYPDYYPLDFVDRRMLQPTGADEVIGKYGSGKLDFEPGSRYSYSNTGYLILGRVVEKVSGQSFGTLLRSRILGPLGMTHTLYEPEPSDTRLARGYTSFALSPPVEATPEAKGWIGAAGALYSTPSDLAQWALGLMDGKVLGAESFKLMTTGRQLPDGTTSEYGCGLSTRIQDKRLVLSHNGAVSGFNAWNAMIPSTKSAVILMANSEMGMGDLPGQMLGLLLKSKPNVPKVSGLATVEAIKKLFGELQKDKVDRSQLGAEFNWYLTPERASGAAKRLRGFGAPTKVEVLQTYERGGMEVSVARLRFKTGTLKTLMYRRPDGAVEQFFVNEE